MATSTDKTQVWVTDSEASVLNAARTILEDIERRASYHSGDTQDSGRIGEAAHIAEHALFRVFNVAHSYGGQSFTYTQLHNRPDGQVPA